MLTFDGPIHTMTDYLNSMWLNGDFGDQDASNESFGGYICRYGKRLLVETSQGDVFSERYRTVKEAQWAFGTMAEELGCDV